MNLKVSEDSEVFGQIVGLALPPHLSLTPGRLGVMPSWLLRLACA
jgi:hypothetical protein